MKKLNIKRLLKATPQEKCKICIQIIKGKVKVVGGERANGSSEKSKKQT